MPIRLPDRRPDVGVLYAGLSSRWHTDKSAHGQGSRGDRVVGEAAVEDYDGEGDEYDAVPCWHGALRADPADGRLIGWSGLHTYIHTISDGLNGI